MTQRRMPSGQGPARGGLRPSAGSGPRPASQRARGRRTGDRTARGEPPPRPANRGHSGLEEIRAAGPVSGAPRGVRPGGPVRAGVRRTAGPARRIRAPRGPRRISGRAATVGLLLLALAFAYAYPVRVYLAQRAQIDQMEQAQSEQRERIQELTEQLIRWDDEQYVIGQARRRLLYVREGELLYVVGSDSAGSAGSPTAGSDAAWFSQLWSSVQAVDNPPAP